jgi:hypothetical protein
MRGDWKRVFPDQRVHQLKSRLIAHPVPAIRAKTPNAAVMLPSESQSVSMNPTTAANAVYLFSTSN